MMDCELYTWAELSEADRQCIYQFWPHYAGLDHGYVWRLERRKRDGMPVSLKVVSVEQYFRQLRLL